MVWLTGILMAAVFGLSSLAGWMVWQRQSDFAELKPTEEISQKSGKQQETTADFKEQQEETESQQEISKTLESQPKLQPQQDITLLFAGDVYFSNYVLNAYDQAGGIQGVLDEGIRQEISQADIFMVNQEFPFTDRGTAAEDKQFTFRLPPHRVSILQEMGADMVTLANNHILDFGTEGLLDSCQTLEEAGIAYIGGGENLDRARELKTLEAGGKTIGFLGTSRVYMDASWAAGPSHPGVFSTYDPAQALESIREAKNQCDYLVVYVHWGVERETEPKEYQKTMGRQYIDAGADLVVGSHPHVLQNIEYYNGKPIVYSLGNFVFGSSIPQTALLKIVLEPDYWLSGQSGQDGIRVQDEIEPHVSLTLIPCTSSNGYTRLLPQ